MEECDENWTSAEVCRVLAQSRDDKAEFFSILPALWRRFLNQLFTFKRTQKTALSNHHEWYLKENQLIRENRLYIHKRRILDQLVEGLEV